MKKSTDPYFDGAVKTIAKAQELVPVDESKEAENNPLDLVVLTTGCERVIGTVPDHALLPKLEIIVTDRYSYGAYLVIVNDKGQELYGRHQVDLTRPHKTTLSVNVATPCPLFARLTTVSGRVGSVSVQLITK